MHEGAIEKPRTVQAHSNCASSFFMWTPPFQTTQPDNLQPTNSFNTSHRETTPGPGNEPMQNTNDAFQNRPLLHTPHPQKS